MLVLGIDPGPVESAYCLYDSHTKAPVEFYTLFNGALILSALIKTVVIEKVASFGMPVGETVFETVFWSGKFAQQAENYGFNVARMTRKEVVTHICGSAKAKDSNVIQAMKDKFGEKGTKKNPGILFGIKADEWQSLALTVAYSEINKL
jgi:hypothetical protein